MNNESVVFLPHILAKKTKKRNIELVHIRKIHLFPGFCGDDLHFTRPRRLIKYFLNPIERKLDKMAELY